MKMAEEKNIENLEKYLEEDKTKKKYDFGIRHLQVACMCLYITVLYIGRSTMGVAILAMTDQSRKNDTNVEIYDWDKNTQGLILSSFFWGYMVMQVPAGVLAKKYGAKPIILIALLSNGILCLILPTMAKYGGWIMVCTCRVFMGLTQSCLLPSAHTLLGRWLPPRERTALAAFVFGGMQIGTIVSMPVSGVLADTRFGWKLIFYSISGLMFVTAAIWYWFSASFPGQHKMISIQEKYYIETELNSSGKRDLPIPWRQILTTVPVWAILVAQTGDCIAFILFFVDLPTYLEKALGVPLKNSAILSSLPYIGMWTGNLLAGNICERLYNRKLLSNIACRRLFNSISMFATATGCVVLACLRQDQKHIAVIVVIAFISISGFSSAGYMVNHLDLSPHFAGVLQAISNVSGSLGSLLTPVITSSILKNDPTNIDRWHNVFFVVAAIAASCNVIYLIFMSTDRQPWDSPDYFVDLDKADPEEMKPALEKLQNEEDLAKRSAEAVDKL